MTKEHQVKMKRVELKRCEPFTEFIRYTKYQAGFVNDLPLPLRNNDYLKVVLMKLESERFGGGDDVYMDYSTVHIVAQKYT